MNCRDLIILKIIKLINCEVVKWLWDNCLLALARNIIEILMYVEQIFLLWNFELCECAESRIKRVNEPWTDSQVHKLHQISKGYTVHTCSGKIVNFMSWQRSGDPYLRYCGIKQLCL